MSVPAEWAVVTGATGAIGPAIVDVLLNHGLSILAVARSAEDLDRLVAGRHGVVACPADLGSDDAIEIIRRAVPGPVAAAVHAAAAPVGGSILEVSPRGMSLAVDVKVNGALRLVRGIDPFLATSARIVLITGNLAYDPVPGGATSGAANAALANVAKQLHAAYASRPAFVYAVAPGPVETPRLRRLAADRAAAAGITEEEMLDTMRRESPSGRFTTVDEVAWAVGLLMSPHAAALAGSTLLLDSGRRTSII